MERANQLAVVGILVVLVAIWLVLGDDSSRDAAPELVEQGASAETQPLVVETSDPNAKAAPEAATPADESAAADERRSTTVSFTWPSDAPSDGYEFTVAADRDGIDAWFPVATSETVTVDAPDDERWLLGMRLGKSSFGWTHIDAADGLVVDATDHPSLAGSVLGPGGPVADAVVTWNGVRTGESATVTTDAGGRFRFGPLPDDEFSSLAVSAQGFTSAEVHDLVADRPSRAAPVVVEVGRSVGLAGRVVDEDSEVVAGAEVELDGDERESDEAGRFAFPHVEEWPAFVVARRADEDGWAVGSVSVPDALAASGPITIELRESEPVTGTLLWEEDGEPVGSVLVLASVERHDGDGSAVTSWTQTLGDGTFTLTGLPPGEVRLRIETPMIAHTSVHATARPIEIRVPAPEVFEFVVWPTEPEPSSVLVVTVDVGGSRSLRRVRLDEGRYTLRATAPSGADVTVYARTALGAGVVLAEGTAASLDGRVLDAPTSLSRRLEVAVTEPTGAAADRLRVTAVWPVAPFEQGFAPYFARRSPFDTVAAATSAHTDDLGLAAFELPTDRPVEVTVSCNGFRPERRRVEPDATRVDIRLAPETPLSVEPGNVPQDQRRDG